MREQTKRAVGIWAASLLALGLVSAVAIAQPAIMEAGVLVDKIDSSTTLVLDEGQRLRLRSDTVIVKEGQKISFADIPTPQQALPGVIMVQWSAVNSDGTAARVKIRHLRN